MNTAAIQVEFGLHLQPGAPAGREAAAWFITGDDPLLWIEELTSWSVSLIDARLYPVPASAKSAKPCGCLVVLQGAKPVTRRAQPYAVVGERLFFPADARLEPAVSEQELRTELLWDVQVLHPSIGLVGFRAEDGLQIHELLAPPSRKEAAWVYADLGVRPRPRLLAVEADAPSSTEDLIDAGRDDIGSVAEEEVPRAPGESPMRDAGKDALTKSLRPLLAGLIAMLSFRGGASGQKKDSKSTPASAETGKPPPLPGRLYRWSKAKLESMNAALEDRRHRELYRLLSLMQSDPDTGLQYALPLRDLITRGLSAPSASLSRRPVEFDPLSQFGGNRPGESWSVPPDIRAQLHTRYREAANRELNLGRFRRAAYIFAHLLGDFSAAADALKRGRYYREAAAIYKERLKNPRAAADCLAAGGLLLEAIPIYRELKLHETAGDLYQRLGQTDEARECFREAVSRLRDRSDFIAAAKLLETRLNAPDEALDLLASTWPDSDHTGGCLREWFGIAGRLGRHDAAATRLVGLREAPTPQGHVVILVHSLSDIAGKYPNPQVRARCADATRVIAGTQLAIAGSANRRSLVKAVTALVPKDRLLVRDGNRYSALDEVKPRVVPFALKETPIVFVRSFNLPADHVWHPVVAISGGFLALGTQGNNCTMVRGRWDGRMRRVSAPRGEAEPISYLLLAPGQHGKALVASLSTTRTAVGPFTLQRIDLFEEDLLAHTPPFMNAHLAGACREENAITWVLMGNDGNYVSLAAHDVEGKVLSTRSLSLSPDRLKALVKPVPMAARKNDVYIACENTLLRVVPGKPEPIRISLPSAIRAMVPSPPFTTTRMVVTFDEGAAVVRDSGDYQILARHLEHPVATLMLDGALVTVGGRNGTIYRSKGAELAPVGTFATREAAPIAVLPAGGGEFGVFDVSGTMSVFRTSPR